jgi:hypothetical protein
MFPERRLPMRNALATACLLACCLAPSPSNAFDHARKGFLMGGSTGLGAQIYAVHEGQDPSSLNSGALATSIRLGLGLDEKTEAYVFNGGATSFAFFYIPIPYTSAVTGVALRRYLHESPSLFASAGAGLGSTSALGFTAGAGLGLMANVGYEYRKHWSVELEGTYANLQPEPPFTDPNAQIRNAFTVAVKFSGTAY